MNKALFNIVVVITTAAFGSSIYLATLENPTDIQKEFSATSNAIASAGAIAIFGLLNDDNDDD